MPIKNSFSQLFCNFKLVGKIFLFILIIMLVATAVLMSILSPVLEGYFHKMQEEAPISPEEFIKHPIKSLERFFAFFTEFLQANSDMVSKRVVYIVIVVIAARFLLLLPLFPVNKILHEKMTSGFDVGLFNAFVNTLAQNLLFNLVFSLITGFVDLAIFTGIIYLTSALLKIIGVISLPISLLIALALYSLRVTVFCQWLPEYFMNKPKNVFLALGAGLKTGFKQFRKNYICIFVTFIIYFAIGASTLFTTFGLVPILLIPTIMVTHTSLCLILNYTYHKHKYFTDNGVTVYNPVKKY